MSSKQIVESDDESDEEFDEASPLKPRTPKPSRQRKAVVYADAASDDDLFDDS